MKNALASVAALLTVSAILPLCASPRSPLVLFGAQSGRPTEADAARTLEDANGKPIPPMKGFWSVKFEKPSQGVLEDYIVTVLGVPALLR